MKNATIILLLSLAVTSCTPKIVGSWNIDRYEIDNYKGENLSARNAGDIQINKNGTGQKNLSIKFFDRQSGQSESFRWDYKDQILRIYDVDSRQSSDFAKSWIVTTNKKKKQVWKSTDGSNSIQIIELSRK